MPSALLTTKLHVPVPRPDLVPRPHLVERLQAGLSRRLTLLSAPAGFGKTTLLAEWLAGAGRPTAWLSLDAGDDDPARFLSYLLGALQTLDSAVGQGLVAALRSPQPPGAEALLTALVNEVADSAALRGAILVLDDYHTVQARSIHQALAFLLAHLVPPPDGLHLVVASRADPPIGLARLRGRGQLSELRAADLRFGPHEASALLMGVLGLEIAPQDVAALERRTEGWITGLQLAALSLRGQDADQASRFVRAFAGSHRYVLDYLMEEVLGRQEASVQAFLLETSILERLCGPLCDAVTGQAGGQARLELLERHNVFIAPLDEERHWYRYHRLFADLLRARLAHLSPELGAAPAAELHRRASAWFGAQGLVTDAIHHALAAGEPEQAADLIEAHGLALLLQGELTTLLGWLAPLPPETVHARPWVSVYAAWALVLTGQLDQVEPHLQAAEAAAAAGPPPAGGLPGHVAAIRTYAAAQRGELDLTRALADLALEQLDPDDLAVRSVVAFTLGGARLLQGDVAAAARAFAQAAEMGLAGGNVHVAVPATAQLADLEAQQGHLHRAFETFERILAMAEHTPVAAQAHDGLGRLLYEWNDLDAAARHLVRSVALAERWGNVDALGGCYTELARLHRARGDLAAVEATLDRAEQLGARLGLGTSVGAEGSAYRRAWLALATDDLAAAERWLREREPHPEQAFSLLREPELLARVRVQLALGQPEAAAPLLARLLETAERDGRSGRVVEVLALQALVHQAQGTHAAALATLQRALALAEPEGYVRTFVDAGEPLRALLAALQARPPESERLRAYVGALLAAFGESGPAASGGPGASGLAARPSSGPQAAGGAPRLLAQQSPWSSR